MEEVCTRYVHLVDITHSRNAILVCLTPYGFRLRLNAALCTENGNGTVKYAERTLNFNSKVNVSGGIYNVDTVTFPVAGRSGRGNCDTSFLLLLHPVHRRGTVMRFTDFMCFTGIEKYSFRRGGFTRIDMSHYTNISGTLKWIFSRHI